MDEDKKLRAEQRMLLEDLKGHKGWKLVSEDFLRMADDLQTEINAVDLERTMEQENDLKRRMQLYREAVNKPDDLLSFLVEDTSVADDNDPYDK